MSKEQPTLTLGNLFAPIPGPTRGQSVHIGKDPKNPNLIYCVGNSVVIRNYNDLTKASLYQEHSYAPTVARFAPTGFYVCSGDSIGKVRVWDTVTEDRILKGEYHMLSGPVFDIAWNDKDRIAVAGQGKERFGAVFFADSGASVGEITGHSKTITSIDFKPTRPFRIVTGSEDLAVNYFEGPPFKFKKAFKEHQRLIQCVRFSTDGEKFISVSGDKTGAIFESKTGEKILNLDSADAHKLGVYSASWSPDSKRILTSSADKTAKIWDAETGKCIATYTLGKEVSDQQLGCLWIGEGDLASIALSGYISFLDDASPESEPKKIIRGHNKLITSLAFDEENNKIYSGDFGSRVLQWDVATGETIEFSGPSHTSQVTALAVAGGKLFSISMDDTFKSSDISSNTWGESIKLDLQPLCLGVDKKGTLAVVGGLEELLLIKGNNIVKRLPVSFQVSSLAVSICGTKVAVGSKDNNIYTFNINGDSLESDATITGHRGAVCTMTYSPDGQYLASADTNREVIVFKKENNERVINGWVFHTSKVDAIAWSPDSSRISSVGTDGDLFVWNVNTPLVRAQAKVAQYGGGTVTTWVNNETVVTGGKDCAIKFWTLN